MKIKLFFKFNFFSRNLYIFGYYALGFFLFFLLASMAYYAYEKSSNEKQKYQKIENEFSEQIRNIEKNLIFAHRRLLNASKNDISTVKILNSYYPLGFRNNKYRPSLDLYVIDKNDTSNVISAYGPTRLESPFPNVSLSEIIAPRNNRAFRYIVTKDFLWCFFLNPAGNDGLEKEIIVLLKIPLPDLLHEGEELQSFDREKELKQENHIKNKGSEIDFIPHFFHQEKLVLFVKKSHSNFLKEYLDKFGITYLLLFFLILFFGLHNFIAMRRVFIKLDHIYKKRYKRLFENYNRNKNELLYRKSEIRELLEINDSYAMSKNSIKKVRNKYIKRLEYLENRLSKKISILIQDLTEVAHQNSNLSNLLEIMKTTKNDLDHLKDKIPEYQSSENIDLKEIINEALNSFSDLIVSKKIDVKLKLNPENSIIHGDEVLIQIALIKLLYKSLERVKPGGKIKICISKDQNKHESFNLELWDDGYNFDDSRLMRYAASSSSESDPLYSLKWDNLKIILDKCSAEILENVYQRSGNRVVVRFNHREKIITDDNLNIKILTPTSKSIN